MPQKVFYFTKKQHILSKINSLYLTLSSQILLSKLFSIISKIICLISIFKCYFNLISQTMYISRRYNSTSNTVFYYASQFTNICHNNSSMTRIS